MASVHGNRDGLYVTNTKLGRDFEMELDKYKADLEEAQKFENL